MALSLGRAAKTFMIKRPRVRLTYGGGPIVIFEDEINSIQFYDNECKFAAPSYINCTHEKNRWWIIDKYKNPEDYKKVKKIYDEAS